MQKDNFSAAINVLPLMGRSGKGLCRLDFFVIENM